MNDTFDLAALTKELTVDEGRAKVPYFDTRHILTGGIGRNLGRGFSDPEIDFMFANDVTSCCVDLDLHTAWWRTLTPARQRVMLNLTFNIGWPRVSLFAHFLAAMETRDWASAAYELRDSKWYNQVGQRGPRVVARLSAPTNDPKVATV